MRISHAGHREFLGYQSQAGNTSAYSNGSEIHTAPLDSSLGPRVLLGLPIPGRNLLTAGGVSETPHTPFGPRGLTITKSAQRWTGSIALTRALYIIHASCTAKGWNRWDHNNNSRHESKYNNSYPSKDPNYYTQRSLTQQYITQRNSV